MQHLAFGDTDEASKQLVQCPLNFLGNGQHVAYVLNGHSTGLLVFR